MASIQQEGEERVLQWVDGALVWKGVHAALKCPQTKHIDTLVLVILIHTVPFHSSFVLNNYQKKCLVSCSNCYHYQSLQTTRFRVTRRTWRTRRWRCRSVCTWSCACWLAVASWPPSSSWPSTLSTAQTSEYMIAIADTSGRSRIWSWGRRERKNQEIQRFKHKKIIGPRPLWGAPVAPHPWIH